MPFIIYRGICQELEANPFQQAVEAQIPLLLVPVIGGNIDKEMRYGIILPVLNQLRPYDDSGTKLSFSASVAA